MTADANALAPSYEHDIIDTHQGIGNPVLGMLLFIVSEIMFFASLFAAYFTLRAGYTEVNPATKQLEHVWPPTRVRGHPPALDPRDAVGRPQPDRPGDDHPHHLVVHLPDRRRGASGATTTGRSCGASPSPSCWA